ncbi:MAG: gliding motility-associated C-terminal domain-containing protein [Taibaiella sp.]|nr:gliding motility-associated C-terminal domain-containing protein [Taibaiella sp.]
MKPDKCHEFLQYRLQVYDRWGRLMFTSYNVQDSWDGTHKGQPCDQGFNFFILSMPEI